MLVDVEGGEVVAALDRANARLMIHAVHAEPDAPRTPEAGRALAAAVEELARFVGAAEIVYPKRVPPTWKRALH